MARSPINPLIKRRVVSLSVVLLLIVAIVVLYLLADTALLFTSIHSGVLLFALVLFLALFNARKKLPFLPLLRASTWLKFHIYVGLLTTFLFVVHVNFRLPQGVLEWVLAVVFGIVSMSGFVGLYLSRTLPKRMTDSGEALTYERIPMFRRRISEAARSLALKAEETCESSTIPDFYLQHVEPFLAGKTHLRLALRGRFREQMSVVLRELDARMRYFSDAEKDLAAELREWIETKGNVDVQEAAQRLLRGWLFVHIPFTYALLILGIVHGILAWRFGGYR